MDYKVGDVVLFDWSDFRHPIKEFFHNIIQLHNIIFYRKKGATHAGIISRIDGDTIWIHEAIGKKDSKDFKEYEYNKWWLDSKIDEGSVVIKRSDIKLTNIKKLCTSYEQTYYDWLSVLLIPFKVCVNSTKLVFCSEVVARILYDASNKKLNIAEELGKPYDKITPIDLSLSNFLK